MHYLDESHILLFLLQLMILLGAARTLGVVFEHYRLPAIAGEILAGVMLGPTLFGRISPELQQRLFPTEIIQMTMLDTVSWLGVFFLLLASGFHVDVTRAIREGRAAMLIGVIGVMVPIAIGIPVFALFDPVHWGPDATRVSFSLFLAVAGSITAISVVARTIGDLDMARTGAGGLVLSACAVNDVFGWFLFTVVISIATATQVDTGQIALTFVLIVGFVSICCLVGSRVMDVAARWVKATSLAQPAATMTLVVSAGLLCGVITQWLGIHAILGFFLAGIMAGGATEISGELRNSIAETFHAVFVPIFFATLGLKIDFVSGMDPLVTIVFLAVAMGGKYFGAWLGARLGRLPRDQATFVGLLFVPGGAMEIVVGILALELGLIGETVFVAIVFAALLSSIIVGPLMVWRGGQVRAAA